jgi:hypothetical protein
MRGDINMKEIRQKLRLYLATFVAVFLLLSSLIFFVATTQLAVDIKLSLVLVIVIIMLIVALWYNPRVFYYNQMYGFARLKHHQAKPVKAKRDVFSRDFSNYLIKKSFKIKDDFGAFVLYHRYTKDEKELVTRYPMLEMLIIIRDQDMGYQDSNIKKAINILEDEYAKNKVKFRNYAIIQIKRSDRLTDDVVKQADQVVFDKQGGRHITVINAHYNTSDETIYFLHSEYFAPTSYYKYVVKLFKSLI